MGAGQWAALIFGVVLLSFTQAMNNGQWEAQNVSNSATMAAAMAAQVCATVPGGTTMAQNAAMTNLNYAVRPAGNMSGTVATNPAVTMNPGSCNTPYGMPVTATASMQEAIQFPFIGGMNTPSVTVSRTAGFISQQ